jgi:hypothetical protein
MAPRDPLSEVPPQEFVKARNALASQLRERGDPEGARRVAARRRPSTLVWTVNQLSRIARGLVEELIESTQRARRAQVEGREGDELREAMRLQRDATEGLLREAEQVAARAGLALTLEQQRRLRDTLQAAAATDPDALREGTLQSELAPAGFGALLSGPEAVVAKAALRKRAFEAHADERKRAVADRRDRIVRQREVQRAQQMLRRLLQRAEHLEHVAQRAKNAAEQAKAKAQEARRAADEANARMTQLRQKN